MSHQTLKPLCDPIMRLRRQRRSLSVAGVLILCTLAAWALWPRADIDLRIQSTTVPDVNTEPEELDDQDGPQYRADPEPFMLARLWNPLPPPPPATADTSSEQTPIVKRPELQLVGIIENNGQRLAAVYHVDHGELIIVASGDRIEPYTVAAITEEMVRFEDGRHASSLFVRKERRP